MTNQNSANETKLRNDVSATKFDKLSNNRISDADLDGVSGGQSTYTAWTGTVLPRRR